MFQTLNTGTSSKRRLRANLREFATFLLYLLGCLCQLSLPWNDSTVESIRRGHALRERVHPLCGSREAAPAPSHAALLRSEETLATGTVHSRKWRSAKPVQRIRECPHISVCKVYIAVHFFHTLLLLAQTAVNRAQLLNISKCACASVNRHENQR